jgi:hypothetical protein
LENNKLAKQSALPTPDVQTSTQALSAGFDPARMNELASSVQEATATIINKPFLVKSPEQMRKAKEQSDAIRTLLQGPTPDKSSVMETFDPLAKMADALHKGITQARAKHAHPLQQALRIIGDAINDYLEREENKAREAERKARAEAEAREAELRATLEAERQAKQRELEQKAAQDREDAARAAEAAGFADVAGDIRENPVSINLPPVDADPRLTFAQEPIVISSAAPKLAGVSRRTVWLFRITKPDAIPAQYLLPADNRIQDPTAYPRVRKVVEALGEQANIPGIEVYQESGVTLSRRPNGQ